MTNQPHPVLAIVIPCFNEAEVLPRTLERVAAVLGELRASGAVAPSSYIGLVDDGSSDATWEVVRRLRGAYDPPIRALRLSRNFGHQNALLAGMTTFPFDVCVTMDADLQDDPAVIPEMIARRADGCDIVYGVRSRRDTDRRLKAATAVLFYRLMRALGVEIVGNHADFRLLSRRAVETLRGFTEVNLFLRGLIPKLGFRSAVVYYERGGRAAGETKYPLRKLLSFAWSGITAFSVVPLRIVTVSGLAIFFIAILASVRVLAAKLAGATVPGWTTIVISVHLLGGLNVFFLGVIGEYVAKIYMEVKRRPPFIVDEELE